MLNRKNVEQTKCRQIIYRTDKMSTDKMHVAPCMQEDTEETIAKYAVDANQRHISQYANYAVYHLEVFLGGRSPNWVSTISRA